MHFRVIKQPIEKVAKLMETLSKDDDKVWPHENWPAMKFKGGIRVGAKGRHGPIRYQVEKYNPKECIRFRFTSPKGFIGTHEFSIEEMSEYETMITHTIDIRTKGKDTLSWLIVVRAMHDALLEDCLDKIENSFSNQDKRTNWSWWVKFVRKQIAKRKKVKLKQ